MCDLFARFLQKSYKLLIYLGLLGFLGQEVFIWNIYLKNKVTLYEGGGALARRKLRWPQLLGSGGPYVNLWLKVKGGIEGGIEGWM